MNASLEEITHFKMIDAEKIEGILLLDKPHSKTAFYLVKYLRSLTKVSKIGHCGTLDPFATGLMVMLIGSRFTKLSDHFLNSSKAYETTIELGSITTTFDPEGEKTLVSDKIPSLEEIESAIECFQGTILQTPPMFSAKKVNGQKLCDLARKGVTVERKACTVQLKITLLSYEYPHLKLHIECSKGTYIRSLGHDLGQKLGTGAYLTELRRVASGKFSLDQALSLDDLENNLALLSNHLIKTVE